MKVGRPTLYDESYCDRVIEYGKQGKSLTWIAAELDVHKDTIYEWVKIYPEFSDALTRAKQLSQKWWEDAGQQNLLSPQGQTFNNATWAKNMSCRFRDDWTDTTKNEHTGANGGAIETKTEMIITIVDADKQNQSTD